MASKELTITRMELQIYKNKDMELDMDTHMDMVMHTLELTKT
jgi:hypothetical protein